MWPLQRDGTVRSIPIPLYARCCGALAEPDPRGRPRGEQAHRIRRCSELVEGRTLHIERGGDRLFRVLASRAEYAVGADRSAVGCVDPIKVEVRSVLVGGFDRRDMSRRSIALVAFLTIVPGTVHFTVFNTPILLVNFTPRLIFSPTVTWACLPVISTAIGVHCDSSRKLCDFPAARPRSLAPSLPRSKASRCACAAPHPEPQLHQPLIAFHRSGLRAYAFPTMAESAKPETSISTNPVFAAPSTKLGALLAPSVPGVLVVEYEGSGPIPARSTVAFDQSTITRAITTRQPALLAFENGDPRLPIIVGLVQPRIRTRCAVPGPAGTRPLHRSRRGCRWKLNFDGDRVVVEGKEEVTLKCGAASITLRRDGKVILRGAYVETTAKGVNRIRGSSVKIN